MLEDSATDGSVWVEIVVRDLPHADAGGVQVMVMEYSKGLLEDWVIAPRAIPFHVHMT